VAIAVGVPDNLAGPLLREVAADKSIDIQSRGADDADVDLLWMRDPEPALRAAARHELAALPGGNYGRPAALIDPARHWIAVSATARVLVYDPQRIAENDVPTKLLDLARPDVARQLVLADPAQGAGAWHAAALMATLGEAPVLEFYRALLANGASIVVDEDAVAGALAKGERAIALTDSDRALAAQEHQPGLVISFPDQVGTGAFVLPAVVSVTSRGADHSAVGPLLDHLLSPQFARRVALTANTILVLDDAAEEPAGLLGIGRLRMMPVSYDELAARLPATRAALRGVVQSRPAFTRAAAPAVQLPAR
jgi:ABC-type Fe3+ transport system substrate-binding protein